MSSSSSTQSLSSPATAWVFPENTSRMDVGSLEGRMSTTSMGKCAVRDDHPGGSIPQLFFQLDRPIVLPWAGLEKAPCRFCATKVEATTGPPRRELTMLSSVERLRLLYGEAVLEFKWPDPSFSD